MSRDSATSKPSLTETSLAGGAALSKLTSLAQHILSVLPADDVAITNRAARALISQRSGRTVSLEEYFSARDELLNARFIGRVRGQGGSIYRLNEKPEVSKPAPFDDEVETAQKEAAKPIAERDLMFIARRALITQFPAELDLPKGVPDPILEDISSVGPKTGIWARPDFVMVCVSRFSVLPGMHVETHVFELKNELGGGVKAVHEALAQGRFANFCHLLWLVPDGSVREAELAGVSSHCALHGVGLIRMRWASVQTASLEVLVDARRTPTTPLEIDGFLEARLSESGRYQLSSALAGSARA